MFEMIMNCHKRKEREERNVAVLFDLTVAEFFEWHPYVINVV